ncbi:MAG: hypothetical protein QOD49_2414 [Actinomycetota bacterium]|nr:hypothetical protein [Actinomycetota bacterium]
MNDGAVEALTGIIASEGAGIVDEPRRLAALLADRCAQHRLENTCHNLMKLFRSGKRTRR